MIMEFQEKSEVLGYKFNNPELLRKALTHPSLCQNQNHDDCYERMEFLGDSVLNLIITEVLLLKFSNENEGKLAKRKSYLVSGQVLAEIAKNHNLTEQMLMSKSEEDSGGRNNQHTLENVLEAIIGAIYLDGGLEKVRAIILGLWQTCLENMKEVPVDSKSKLQEVMQSMGKGLPHYRLIESSGPQHMLSFKVSLYVEGYGEVIAKGRTKQQAEKETAKLMLDLIND